MTMRQDPTHEPPLIPPAPPTARSDWRRLALLLAFLGVFIVGYAAGLHRDLEWNVLRANVTGWREQARQNLPAAMLLFFAAFVTLTALSLPVSGILSLVGGALFDRWLGTCVVNVSATTGATLAFLTSRYLFHDQVRAKLGHRLRLIDRGVQRDGAFYVFGLRLTPLVPYFLINLGLALTPMRLRTFVFFTWLGMLLPNFLYANAGEAISHIEHPRDALSLEVLGSLALLGVMPLAFRFLVTGLRRV
jgi:uncharacterized membrane protein YdjX (TVP38/TMEM64 family)